MKSCIVLLLMMSSIHVCRTHLTNIPPSSQTKDQHHDVFKRPVYPCGPEKFVQQDYTTVNAVDIGERLVLLVSVLVVIVVILWMPITLCLCFFKAIKKCGQISSTKRTSTYERKSPGTSFPA